MRSLRRLITSPLIVLAAVLLWAEEGLWELVKALAAHIARFPPLRWYEALIVRLPPYPTLVAFLIPTALLFPVKIGALWLASHHHAVLGFGTIVGAKVLGTTIFARSFVVARPKLMTIRWFAILYDGFLRVRTRIYTAVRGMPVYQRTRRALDRMRERLRAAMPKTAGRLTRRWRAARRHIQRTRRGGGSPPPP